MSDMDDVINEFLVESYENLEQVDLDLLALEEDPRNRSVLDRVFRTVHTIKGTCGFLDFVKLESVAHAGENLLDMLRDGTLSLTPEIASGLLAMVDAVRKILAEIEANKTEGAGEYGELVERLHALQTNPGGPAPAPAATDEVIEAVAIEAEAAATEGVATEGVATEATAPASPLAAAGPPAAEPEAAAPAEPAAATSAPANSPVAAGVMEADEAAAKREDGGRGVADSTIRVEVSLLDKLMNLVGELVLARNQILQYTVEHEDSTLLATSQRLNIITTELQGMFMKTRMQPISTVWNKFPRIVRDLAQICGKKVRVEMEGRETECDKTLIEAIKDPLTHVIRNSVDHGIETPAARREAGKPEEGVLFLRAYHEGGSVNIEIQDDGAGLNVDRIRQKALERGLISAEEAATMTDRVAAGLIFRAGFSTAEKVSNLSGRGVGMDVVKTNIEKIGGKVEIQSNQGVGTTLRVKIPLTLAIVPALTVTSGAERFAIPQISLVELVRIEPERIAEAIEDVQGAPVYRLRGRLLPIVYLNEQLRLAIPEDEKQKAMNIVVLHAENKSFGLVVDEVNDTQEIVVKPVGNHLQGIPVFAGATIMGDGQVALILDVMGLAQRAKIVSEVRDVATESDTADGESQYRASDSQTLLLFQSPDDGRMAVPLSSIARLEEFKQDTIEYAGSGQVVQYRDQILELIRLTDVLPERRAIMRSTPDEDESQTMHVLVYRHGEKCVGLVVEKILDILDTELRIRGKASRPGVSGTAVIRDRVTELLDLEAVIRRADPTFFEEQTIAEEVLA